MEVVQVPHNHTILTGLPVKIECKIRGLPTPTIRWFHENSDGTLVPVTQGVYNIPDGSHIEIINAYPKDAGKYICQATNGVETI